MNRCGLHLMIFLIILQPAGRTATLLIWILERRLYLLILTDKPVTKYLTNTKGRSSDRPFDFYPVGRGRLCQMLDYKWVALTNLNLRLLLLWLAMIYDSSHCEFAIGERLRLTTWQFFYLLAQLRGARQHENLWRPRWLKHRSAPNFLQIEYSYAPGNSIHGAFFWSNFTDVKLLDYHMLCLN